MGRYLGLGEGKAIWVGDNLQEDVHGLQDGGHSFVIGMILDDLETKEIWGSLLSLWGHPLLLRAGWPFGDTKRTCQYLLGEPDAAGLCHPLAGVDAGVDPDGRAVRAAGAELGEQRAGLGFVPVTCPCHLRIPVPKPSP